MGGTIAAALWTGQLPVLRPLQEQPPSPLLQGISMGGMIAAALAAFNSDRFGKIVLAPGSGGSPNSEKAGVVRRSTIGGAWPGPSRAPLPAPFGHA